MVRVGRHTAGSRRGRRPPGLCSERNQRGPPAPTAGTAGEDNRRQRNNSRYVPIAQAGRAKGPCRVRHSWVGTAKSQLPLTLSCFNVLLADSLLPHVLGTRVCGRASPSREPTWMCPVKVSAGCRPEPGVRGSVKMSFGSVFGWEGSRCSRNVPRFLGLS